MNDGYTERINCLKTERQFSLPRCSLSQDIIEKHACYDAQVGMTISRTDRPATQPLRNIFLVNLLSSEPPMPGVLEKSSSPLMLTTYDSSCFFLRLLLKPAY